MQLIAFQPSTLLARLRLGSAALTVLAGAALLAEGWVVAALCALLAAAWALRTPMPQGRLGLRADGLCEWQARSPSNDHSDDPARGYVRGQPDGTVAGPAGAEMALTGMLGAGGWLVLRLAGRDTRRILVLAPDSAAPQDLRRLRVWLKWAAPQAELNSGSRRWS